LSEADEHHCPPQSAQSPPPDSEPIPENNAPDPNKAVGKTEAKEKPSSEKFDLAMLRWTRVVGFFTAVLALVGLIQAWAFMQRERAFITVDDLSIHGGMIAKGQPIRVFMVAKNSGHSAAIVQDVSFNIKFGPLPDAPNYLKLSLFALAPIPGGSTNKSTASFAWPDWLTDQSVADIKNETLPMSIFGYVKYTDEFSFIFGPRTTGFCSTYTSQPVAAGQFNTCDQPKYTYAN